MPERANRYKIVRPVEYRFRSLEGLIAGSGLTINISCTGVLFQANCDLEVGRRIELVIRMGPTMGDRHVKLMVEGLTVRNEDGYVAVATRKHKLRSDGGDSGPAHLPSL